MWNDKTVKKYLPDPVPLKRAKLCACGRFHVVTTKDAVIAKDGYILFNCPCGSTIMATEPLLNS